MKVEVIGIGEAIISNNPLVCLKTYSLSTCVAVTAHSSLHQAAGMIHIALPFPIIGTLEPLSIYRYASTGIPQLFERLRIQYGCQIKDLIIQIFGGAEATNQQDSFRIGPQNVEAVKQVLASLHARCHYENTGGNRSRTLEMNVSDGCVRVTTLPLAF